MSDEQEPIAGASKASYETLESAEGDNDAFNPAGKEGEKSSMFGATMNFINAIVGAGIIAMPYALKECGPSIGILSLFIIGGLSGYTLILLFKTTQWTQKSTYQEVVASTLGQPFVLIITIMQFSYPFLAMVSYQIIVSDNLSTIVKALPFVSDNSWIADRRVLLLIATIVIVLPLSYVKAMQSLYKVSVLSVIAVMFLVMTVVYKAITQPHHTGPTSFGMGKFVIQSWGIILFAFVCHHNSFLILGTLKEKTEANVHAVVWSSVGVSSVFMCVLGICGYVIFTDRVVGNLLQNFCPCDVLVNFARIAFIIGVVSTFPLECLVCRDIIMSTFFRNSEPSELRHALITVAIVVTVSVVSVVTDKLGLLLEVAGIISAIPYAFIFPPLLYLKLDPNGSTMHAGKICAILMLTFGCLFFILGFTGLVIKIISNVPETPDLRYCEVMCNSTVAQMLNI